MESAIRISKAPAKEHGDEAGPETMPAPKNRLSFQESGGDKAVEFMRSGGPHKSPAQMGLADGAEHDLPGVSRKPGEFRAHRAMAHCAGGRTEAADFKDNASGIEKGVQVPAIDQDALLRRGDPCPADPAEQPFILISNGPIPGRSLLGCFGRPQLNGAEFLFTPIVEWPCSDRS